MIEKIIGGEFEILDAPIAANKKLPENYIMYSSGRAALFHILKYAISIDNCKCVYLPDYICDSVFHVCDYLCLPYKFYPVADSLQVDVDALKKMYMGGGVIVVVNYFGLVSCELTIKQIRKECSDAIIVLDDVQAPFLINEPTNADVSFTSLRKAYPLPDGGLVHLKSFRLSPNTQPSKFPQYKIAASYLKNLRVHDNYDDEIYLDLYHKGEELIDDDYDNAPSKYTLQSYPSLDIQRMSILRKRNAVTIQKGLERLGLKPCVAIPKDSVPLFIPIILKDRDKVRKAMYAHNIFLPVHWPVEEHVEELKRGVYMAKHELSIIIDHRYTSSDMEKILSVLENNI